MKRNRRLWALTALLLAVSLLLTACGKKKKTEEDKPVMEPVYEESTEEKTLLFDLPAGDDAEPSEKRDDAEEPEEPEESEASGALMFDGTKYQMSFVLFEDGTGYVSDTTGSDPVTHQQESGIITITIPSENVIFTGVLQEDGSMYVEAVDETFLPVDEPGYVPAKQDAAKEENFFGDHGMLPNWEADGRYDLDNSARYFSSDGSEYQTGKANWELVEEGAYDNGDGTRTVKYTLLCGFLPEENPGFTGMMNVGCTYGIFDAYTGCDLSGDAYYREADNRYEFRYTANGEEIEVSYRVDAQWVTAEEFDEWGYDQGEVDNLFVAELWITLPVDYDGLRIVAMISDPTYEEFMAAPDMGMQTYPQEMLYLIGDGLIYEIR